MDQLHNQSIANFTHSTKTHYYLVKLTQILVSVSVCSFILSPTSLFAFFHYLKFYFSTFPFQLYTHNIDKNSMFLLCNGLLVFVGITKSLSGSSGCDKPSKYIEDGSHSQTQLLNVEANQLMMEVETMEKSVEPDEKNYAIEQVIEIGKYDEEEVEKIILVDEEQGKGRTSEVEKEEERELDEEIELLDVADEEGQKGSELDHFMIEESIEDEEEEERWVLSTEELNKKFEDFIRKMKEDLRIEAQRQLVMV